MLDLDNFLLDQKSVFKLILNNILWVY